MNSSIQLIATAITSRVIRLQSNQKTMSGFHRISVILPIIIGMVISGFQVNAQQFPGGLAPMFPIEINVPDTIKGMWNAMMVMWNAMQDYFSSGGMESSEPRIKAILEIILREMQLE